MTSAVFKVLRFIVLVNKKVVFVAKVIVSFIALRAADVHLYCVV